jgi:two-component system, sensor histidine kinase LadS
VIGWTFLDNRLSSVCIDRALLLRASIMCALLSGVLPPLAAAQPALVLDQHIDGRKFGGHQALFEDAEHRFDITRVSHGAAGVTFTPISSDAPSLGFSKSSVWLRFSVDNPTAARREWLLEVAYPHVDVLELYIPGSDGSFEKRASGDRRPFAERDLPYRNVVFRVPQAPGVATYYLRAETTGALTLPLVAWSNDTFVEQLNVQQPALWMFYGLMVAIALYNLFIFLSVRQIAYLYYVLHTSTYALFQLVLNGLAFQYLWPNAVWWANQCMPACIAFSFFTGVQFHRHFLDLKRNLPQTDRLIAALGTYSALAATFITLALPYAVGIRAIVVLGTAVIVVALYSTTRMVLKRHRPAYFYAAAWGVLLIGIMAYLLKTMNILPTNAITEWAIQIGASLETILLSLGLADRINVMRRDLQSLNVRLGENVEQLQHALARAEDARRAKSEFLASVSHELRTPLNTIINVPEGLREEFHPVVAVSCKQCESVFELEPGEQSDAAASCPECHAVAALAPTEHYVYRGSPKRTVRYLDQVMRSGSHLLEVVNDILDVSRLEAGQMTIHKQPTDMNDLIERVIGPMSGLAERQGTSLQIEKLPEPCTVFGDTTKLGQIFINLVGNAIKFSDRRGAVKLCVRREGEHFVFSVHDQGIGISSQDQSRIFESFVQAEGGGTRRFGGSGLGLAITKKLVLLHQGEIWVESELGHGSTFHVRLPVFSAPALRAESANSNHTPVRIAGTAS